jgi:hypothetical protein
MSTLAVNQHTPVDATAGPVSMALPTGAAQGDEISCEKYDSTANTVTITGNIRGVAAQSVTLALAKETIGLRADSSGSWWPIAGHKTLSSLDGRFTGKTSDGLGAAVDSGHHAWMLRARQISGGALDIPVPVFRPNGPNAAYNLALDLMPKGNPGSYGDNGLCWIDVCNRDISDNNATGIVSARIGVFDDHIEFGSRAFNGAALQGIRFALGGVAAMIIDAATGNITHEYGDPNAAQILQVKNTNTGTGAYAQVSAVASGGQILLRSFGGGFTGDPTYQNVSDVSATGLGGLVASASSGPVRVIPGSTTISNATALFSTSGSVVLGKLAALPTNATDGFLYTPSGAGAPTGTPTARTGVVPMYFDTTNSKFWAYIGGAWKGVALT